MGERVHTPLGWAEKAPSVHGILAGSEKTISEAGTVVKGGTEVEEVIIYHTISCKRRKC